MYRVITVDGIVYDMDGKCNHVYTGDPLYLKCSEKSLNEQGEVIYKTLFLFSHSQVAHVEWVDN